MSHEQHVLIIPPVGLMEVVHTDEEIEPATALTARGSTGDLVDLTLTVGLENRGRVVWYVNHIGPMNDRAREALAMLTGAHMIMTGHVMFLDVHPDRVYEIVAQLSRKE